MSNGFSTSPLFASLSRSCMMIPVFSSTMFFFSSSPCCIFFIPTVQLHNIVLFLNLSSIYACYVIIATPLFNSDEPLSWFPATSSIINNNAQHIFLYYDFISPFLPLPYHHLHHVPPHYSSLSTLYFASCYTISMIFKTKN